MFMRVACFRYLVLFLLCSCISYGLYAQERQTSPPTSGKTSLETKTKPSPPSGKKIYVLYKTDFKGTMSGNKCVEDLSRKMGFRYEQVMKEGPGSKTGGAIFLHNFGTKIILMFRNGPFWQSRFKKRMKECRQKTGDFVG